MPTQKNSVSWDLQLGFNLPFKRLIVQQKGSTCLHILPVCKNHWPSEHKLCRKVVSIFRAKWHMFIVQAEPIMMVDSAAPIRWWQLSSPQYGVITQKWKQVPTKPWKSDLYVTAPTSHVPSTHPWQGHHSNGAFHAKNTVQAKSPPAPPISNQVSHSCFHTLSCNVITTFLQYSGKSKSQFTCTNKVLYLL